MGHEMNLAKSMLGGSGIGEDNPLTDNGVPGPAAYE